MNTRTTTMVSALTGTTFMTLFSHLLSVAEDENFSEPEHLGQLIGRLSSKLNAQQGKALGWLGHYSVGLLFASAYTKLWRAGKFKSDPKHDLLLGALTGLLAVGVWKTAFKLHPSPQPIKFNKFYLQLIPAHIVFAMCAGVVYRALSKRTMVVGHEVLHVNFDR